MTSPFDPNWRPPSPRVSGGQIGIAVGIGLGLMIVTYVVAGIVIGTSIANSPVYSYSPYPTPVETSDPLMPGVPGSPVAVSPLTCASACFNVDSVAQMILPDAILGQVGFGAADVRWRVDPLTGMVATHEDDIQNWVNSGLSPDECFPTWSESPDVTDVYGVPLTDDPAGRALLTVGPDGMTVTQTARVFVDQNSATSYMSTLSDATYRCLSYDDSHGDAVVTVLPESALPDATLPERVAAVGVVRIADNGDRVYMMDLQCGNVVIRSTAHSNAGFDQEELFRELMTAQADRMATVTPVS